MNSKKMKLKLSRELIRKQDFGCPLCGYVMTFLTSNIDHIIPKCRGGGSGIGNLQLAHIECNHKKGGQLQKGYSHIQYPIVEACLNKRKVEGRKEKQRRKTLARAAANGNEYARKVKKNMDEYYRLVEVKYDEVHPI